MSRQRIEDGLETFQEWMEEERELAYPTARSYVCLVRGVVRALGENVRNQESLDSFFRELRDDKPASAANTRTAWRMLSEFVAEKGGSLPLPARTTKRGKGVPPLPSQVREALRLLKADGVLAMRDLTHLTWSLLVDDMDTAPVNRVRLRHPTRPNEFSVVPTEIMRTLRDYAVPRPDGRTPIVPREPGGVEPYPHRALLAEMKIYE